MRYLLSLSLLCATTLLAIAQPVDPSLFGGLHWRSIGPFRGGRALAVTGVPGQPETFYFGAVGGGVWKTENAGRTWTPIFDKEPVASIGDIRVAPSNPNIVYVGSGEADMRSDIQQGDGMYKSTDAGKTWTHIGLDDSRQIGKILVEPNDPNTVYVAALGHQYGPNKQRGVFKSTDGGKTWKNVLDKGPDIGAIDLAMDPDDAGILYAAMWHTRRPPWSVYPPSKGEGSGLFKSRDGGATWTQIQGGGFPTNAGRIGVAVSPANRDRVYAFVDTDDPKTGGIYRSDDAGQTWTRTDGEARVWGRGWYFAGITADPKDQDKVYVMNTSAYRSTDGGKSFTPFKGAPGGDDYHTLWLDPNDPKRMILGCDQGVVVSVDDGKTWSSWYNQPTGQFYHIVTDNRFPYWIYGSQQDSGAMATPSRSIHSGISWMDARPINAGGESGTIAPDPLHPGLLYSNGGSKEQIETGWERGIDPTLLYPDTVWRSEWTQPIAVSPANLHVFYTSHQNIFRTDDGGNTWKIISPDLTRKTNFNPPNLDAAGIADNEGNARRGVVYWIAPSPVVAKQVWAGTDDGLLWLTGDDGAHWKNVTPPELTPWSKIGIVDAGHFDANTAYIAVDRHRIDDNHPYIYRTHDRGKHWRLITNGIPAGQFVNVVREDPKRAGLLYAGTDWGVFVSVDDGDHWYSLQLDLPAASVRDIVFGGNDVVVGTHGRAIWILDDVSRLRQMSERTLEGRHELAGRRSQGALYAPSPAVLFQRAGTFGYGRFDEGTPLPPEEPQGENPPWGAIIDYILFRTPGPTELTTMDGKGLVGLTITNAKGHVLRRISSVDAPTVVDLKKLDIPAYWVKPEQGLSAEPGGHRYVWDLRARNGQGPLVPPGIYQVSFDYGVNGEPGEGRYYMQREATLQVLRDQRVSATDADLVAQYNLACGVLDELDRVNASTARCEALLAKHAKDWPAAKLADLKAFLGGGRRKNATGLRAIAARLGALEGSIESAPSAPTKQEKIAFAQLHHAAALAIGELKKIAP